MPRIRPSKEQLRAQIAAAQSQYYSADSIESRIAASLLKEGRFDESISSEDLGVVLRNVVFTMFAQYTIAGLDVGLVHNVPVMKVTINNSEADVQFIVHIHKPIVAFLKFRYKLINDPVSVAKQLRVKRGSLTTSEHTRRFDFKAKAALAATNLSNIARKELNNVNGVIYSTLLPRLELHGIAGSLTCLEMAMQDRDLLVCLEGEFRPLGAVPIEKAVTPDHHHDTPKSQEGSVGDERPAAHPAT
jgi:hypothetical protein